MSSSPDQIVASTQTEEGDVWWGSYSLWAVIPEFVACLLATALLAWLSWLGLPLQHARLTFLGVGAALWLVGAFRWSHRVFGHNYRLTTRRLFCHLGLRADRATQADLDTVSSVSVSQSWHERLVGVGRVNVYFKDMSRPSMVLKGVRNSEGIAAEIRARLQPECSPVARG
jgi:hypothetical protein